MLTQEEINALARRFEAVNFDEAKHGQHDHSLYEVLGMAFDLLEELANAREV